MGRVQQIISKFSGYNIDALLITSLSNIRYLTNFSGSAASVLVTKNKSYFITDFRYLTQSKEEVFKEFEVVIFAQGSLDWISEIAKKEDLKNIGFESHILSFSAANSLKEKFNDLEFLPVNALVEPIVYVKCEYEIEMTKKAVEITDKTFETILGMIKPGMTENELAAEITYIQRKLGAETNAFEPIVASGVRSAFPHARPTDKKIEKGEFLKLDFGCVYRGLRSDMTRTIGIGSLNAESKKIYSIVKEAQQRALDAVKAGESTKHIDSAARDYITENGYGDKFGHGLGHGLGYDIHETPSLNQRIDFILEENNIVTIEPGIYVEGLGGVRIEDDVVVKKEGCEILNTSPKELIIL
ncbi:Xaa-Pro dipeptidase [soil metagenome]